MTTMTLKVYGREESYTLPIVEPEELEYLYRRRETYDSYEYCYSYKSDFYYSDLKHMFEEYPGTELTTYDIKEEDSGDITVIVPDLHFLDSEKIEVLSYYQKYGSTPLLVMCEEDKFVLLTGSKYQHVAGSGKPVIIGYRYGSDVVLLPLLESKIFTFVRETFTYGSEYLHMSPLGELTDSEKEEFSFSITGLSILKDITDVLEVALSGCDEHIKSGYKMLTKQVFDHIEYCEQIRHSESEELGTGLGSFSDVSGVMIDKYIMLEKRIKEFIEEFTL